MDQPARRVQALEEVVDDLLRWRGVAREAVASPQRLAAVAWRRLEGVSVPRAATATGSVQDALRETERSRREGEEAEAGVRFRAERVERSTQYVHQTVVRWRGSGGRPLQLAELGNAAAGQAARRLDGCLSRCRAAADGVQLAVAAVGDARVSSVAEQEAVAGARQAWARGAGHLEALRASCRVKVTSDEAWRRIQRGVTWLTGQEEALRRYDQPVDYLR